MRYNFISEFVFLFIILNYYLSRICLKDQFNLLIFKTSYNVKNQEKTPFIQYDHSYFVFYTFFITLNSGQVQFCLKSALTWLVQCNCCYSVVAIVCNGCYSVVFWLLQFVMVGIVVWLLQYTVLPYLSFSSSMKNRLFLFAITKVGLCEKRFCCLIYLYNNKSIKYIYLLIRAENRMILLSEGLTATVATLAALKTSSVVSSYQSSTYLLPQQQLCLLSGRCRLKLIMHFMHHQYIYRVSSYSCAVLRKQVQTSK